VYGAPCILGHVVFAGNTLEDGVWKTLDGFLKTRWRHPNGWMIGIDGTAIDSGGREGRTQKVYDFCYPRMSRYIFAIKGLPGPRKIWTKLTSVKGDMRAFGVAVDVLKTEVLDRLARDPFNEDCSENPQAFRLSDQLSDEFLEQVTNETRRVRFVKNRPVIEFQPKRAGAPTEGLDCACGAPIAERAVNRHAREGGETAAAWKRTNGKAERGKLG
jgi:phage terminase large subunit GpA-like protein